MTKVFSIWTIYDHPLDYPEGFIARRWEIGGGGPEPRPTSDVVRSISLEHLQEIMETRGLTCIPRNERDEPQVVESWI